MEKTLANFESHFARIMRNTIVPGGVPRGTDRAIIAGFLALMLLRLPATLDIAEETIRAAGQAYMQVWRKRVNKKPEDFAIIKAEMESLMGVPWQMTAERFIATPLALRTDRSGVLAHVFGNFAPWATKIAAMNWSFAITYPPDYFITSDWPIALVDKNLDSPSQWMPALDQHDSTLTLPLSRTITLVAHHRRDVLSHYGVTPDQVLTNNLVTCQRARDLYVAPKTVFPGHGSRQGEARRGGGPSDNSDMTDNSMRPTTPTTAPMRPFGYSPSRGPGKRGGKR